MSDRAIRASRLPLRTGRLPATAAFWLQLSIVVFFLASSSAPTPLYARYQAEWGFSPITVTAVFGVYALAVLAALLTVGSQKSGNTPNPPCPAGRRACLCPRSRAVRAG
ncbi:MAG TPA: hypothetical protein VIJ82_29695 [Streptosporangiaceae bacterium]|jgi:hypothetical protein